MNSSPILAFTPDYATFMIVAVIVLIVAQIVSVLSRFKRCPAGKIIVVFGKLPNGKAAMCINGGGVFVWPLIQDFAYMSLAPMRVAATEFTAVAKANEPVSLSVNANVAISTEPDVMQNAAERLLGLDETHIIQQTRDIIVGQARRIISSFDIDQVPTGADDLASLLQPRLDAELRQLGLHVVSLDVQRFASTDSHASPSVPTMHRSPTQATADADCGGVK